jgi:glycerol-3-phosphate dehydrogenase subunit C
VLERNGIQVVVSYDGCCGMPRFEKGDLLVVQESAKKISSALIKYESSN